MGAWSMELDQALLQTIIKRPDVANIIYADYKEDVDLINKLAGRARFVMTPDTARILRASWEKAGNMYCDHLVLVLQTTQDGDLTGQYVCARCGAEICHKKLN
jgi:hypothetical protein